MEKVMKFMKQREYRTAEFFRMLDKDGSRNLTCDELASRLLVNQLHVQYGVAQKRCTFFNTHIFATVQDRTKRISAKCS